MARPPRQYSGSLSPGQASYVLERLIGERRVSANDIERYVKEMQSEISTLEQRLQRLRDAAGPAVVAAAAGIAAGAAGVVAATAVRRGRKRGRPGRPPGRPGRPPGRRGRSAASAGAAAGAGTGAANGGGAAATPARARARRGRKAGGGASITPEQLASRQLQGRYLALVRRFPESRRSYYAKVAKEKGREAAIKEMQDAAKK